jgi:hypothetical protein
MENMNVDYTFVRLVVNIMDNTEEVIYDDYVSSGHYVSRCQLWVKVQIPEAIMHMSRPSTVMVDHVEVKHKWKCRCC